MIRMCVAARAPLTVTLAVMLLSALPASAQTGHTFVPLDPPDAVANSFAPDVNDNGVVLVRRTDGTYTWTRQSGLQPLITDPIVNAKFRGLAINNYGRVLGIGCPNGCPNLPEQPATWSSTDGLVFLPLDSASAISVFGTIVGRAGGVPVILPPDQTPIPIPGASTAVDINDHGRVVGRLTSGDAYVWSPGSMTTIPRLPGRTDAHWQYSALRINFNDRVIGEFRHAFVPGDPESGAAGLFFWSSSTGTVDLQIPWSEPLFEAVDLNNRTEVVATVCCDAAGFPRALLLKNGTWSDVNQLAAPEPSMTLARVYAINSQGTMTGSRTNSLVDCGSGMFACPAYALIAPAVDVTANGTGGQLTLGPGDPLEVRITFSATGTLNPAEVYIGFATPWGAFWLHPTAGLSTAPAPLYQGALPAFSVTLLNLSDASVLASGLWVWFAIVDEDTNGVVNLDRYGVVSTTITAGGSAVRARDPR